MNALVSLRRETILAAALVCFALILTGSWWREARPVPLARASSANAEVLLAVWLVAAGVAIPLLERMQNMRALGWGLSSALLGLAILAPLALQSSKRKGATEHAGAGPREVVALDKAEANRGCGRAGQDNRHDDADNRCA